MSDFPFQKIATPLISWYRQHARVLPWRIAPYPYHVWVSEIMLQQTRVAAVIPYYEKFINTLPTISALANAPEEQLLKLWEGLGYYSRVRNLQKAAKIIVSDFDGKLPVSAKLLQTLPGIGPYTAGAIASIAFALPVPAVDGNVLRVMTRLTADAMNISNGKNRKIVESWISQSFLESNPSSFTQGMMELGATICLPQAFPLCESCPLKDLCRAYQTGTQLNYPVKNMKKQRRKEEYTIFLIIENKEIALQKRPPKGVLAGLWQFPSAKGSLNQEAALLQLKSWGISTSQIKPLAPAKHIFTHIEWHMAGYIVHAENQTNQFVFSNKQDIIQKYAIPSAYSSFVSVLDTIL